MTADPQLLLIVLAYGLFFTVALIIRRVLLCRTARIAEAQAALEREWNNLPRVSLPAVDAPVFIPVPAVVRVTGIGIQVEASSPEAVVDAFLREDLKLARSGR